MPIIISKDNSFITLLRSNFKEYYRTKKRKLEDKIHVSDILWSSCLRKAYYARVIDNYNFTDDDIDNFVRGEASEHALVDLANIGVSQQELFFDEDLVARPDLMCPSLSSPLQSDTCETIDENNKQPQSSRQKNELIIEFKDTKSFERLTPKNSKFKAYLRQLLYYLVISELDTGILCIRYVSNRKLVWIKSDEKGDYFFSPKINKVNNDENKMPEIETWTIILERNSPIRDLLRMEIRNRVSLLKSAIAFKNPNELPKVAEEWKCIKCPFQDTCDPLNVKKQDNKKDFLDDDGRIIVLN